MATFIGDALPVSISGPVGIGKVSLLDLLQQAYGDQASSIQSVNIAYWDASYLASIKGSDGTSNPFSYWDPAHPTITKVLSNGVDIGGSGVNSMGNTVFKPVTIDASHFKDVQIAIGNNIMPNLYVQVAESSANGSTTVWHELNVTTIPHQLTTHGPSDHAPTAADIVSTAKFFANVEHGVANTNDCHFIAMDIAASAGATFDPNTQNVSNPALNEEGGFWRIAYRGSDAGAVSNWESKVQAGDIVRMGWTGGGFHTATVTAGLNADGMHAGQIQVVDNGGDPVTKGGPSTIQEHWVDYDSKTMTGSVTIYRLTTDDKYLIDHSSDAHDNTILGTKFNDLIKGGDGADTLRGGAGNDDLRGGSGNDTLIGGTGDDTLDGGIGRDIMRGGSGNDTYVVNSRFDVVDETLNIHGRHIDAGGIDTVRTSLSSYSLENHKEIENLTFIGSGGFIGTGNDKANQILGGFGNDTLSGGAGNDTLHAYNGDDRLDGGTGADTMLGGRGNDTYVVDNVGDIVSELGPDAIVIPMPFGMDIKIPGDMGGIDTIETTLSSFALNAASSSSTLAWIENLTFTGTGNFAGTGNALANTIIGGDGDDQLLGMEGDDRLYAGSGNDVLNGGTGNDRMVGGAGNDVYIVDSVNDKVVELTARRFPTDSGGIDEIRTTLGSYSLENNASISGKVENLSFIGTGNFLGHGNALDNVITGNNGADSIGGGAGNDVLRGFGGNDLLYGDEGNDTLVGGEGADVMNGGSGNDIYYVDNVGDVVQEASFSGASVASMQWGDSGGIDEVRTTLSSYTLSDSNAVGFLNYKGNIENLTFTGTGSFTGHGNGLDNVITGGAGNDKLFGGAGDDSLFGGAGKDVLTGGTGADKLTGGTGADRFVFALGDNGTTAATADHVTDFEKGDTLDVSSFVASHSTIEASRDFGGDIAKALAFANAELAAGHNVAGSAVLTDTASHNVYVFMDQNGDHKFESAVILDHADTHKSEIHTEIQQHQLFI